MSDTNLKQQIEQALAGFATKPLATAALELFGTLGYKSERRLQLRPATAKGFLAAFDLRQELNRERALIQDWQAVEFLFQLTDAEIRAAGGAQMSLFDSDGTFDGAIMESYVFFAIDLRSPQERTGERTGKAYTRSELAGITRAVNRLFTMPAMVLFRQDGTLTFAVIDRRLSKVDATRDVLEKVTLIKDIRGVNPHRAHVDILADLALPELHREHGFTCFAELHRAWRKTLDIQELNKRFYQQLQYWYFWALGHTRFPDGAPKDADRRDSLSLIRLLTRLLFVWFIKEKNLVPETLFDERALARLLRGFAPVDSDNTGSVYYRAILQNLFFATLNQEPDQRGWARDGQNFMAHSLYRHRSDFAKPDSALELFMDIPFLNGGLFECLDKDLGEGHTPRYLRVDGFSRRVDSQPCVPDFLFFGSEQEADLSAFFPDAKKKTRPARVRGLIRIFQDFKFTVEENTPLEEDVALDPELLGRVFENLLAAYNPETQITARKQTGSFYTPREIVDYMTGQALFYALRERLAGMPDLDARLHALLAFDDGDNPFGKGETMHLIAAVDSLKVLDPACGSGAFPMGVLHRLVHVLGKLDPGNQYWKDRQLAKAAEIPDAVVREKVLTDIDQAFAANELGYGRKLYLIENCLYGVDIQPIACQIAKLRFFISLVVEQRECPGAPNRGIRPLPNLETKVVAANTLIGIERPGQQLLRNQVIDAKEAELRRVRHEHFLARTPKTKAKYREEDARLRGEIANLLKDDGWDSTTARLLSSWDPYDQNAHAEFFDPEWMFGICVGQQTRRGGATLTGSFSAIVTDELTPAVTTEDGFDVVIANPPYVRHETISGLREALFRHYTTAASRADLFVFFFERGTNVLRPGGILCFISSNKYFRSAYGVRLRQFLGRETRIREIIDFGDAPVFDAIAYASIFVASRGLPPADHRLVALSWPGGVDFGDIRGTLERQGSSLAQIGLDRDGWRFNNSAPGLLDKLRAAGTPLKEYVDGRFYRGIITGLNDAFVIDGETRARLVAEDPKSAELIKPWLRGRDVKRWRAQWGGLYVLAFPFGFHTELGRFPAVLRHLSGFEEQLRKRGQCVSSRGGQDGGQHHWLELDNNPRPVYLTEFALPKVIIPAIERSCAFAFDDEGYYSNDKTTICVSKDARFLCGVLNSSVVWWYVRQVAAERQNGYYEFKPMYVSSLPIVQTTVAEKQRLTTLVDRILVLKRADPTADITDLDAEVDTRVARLYGLTEEEFAMVLQSGSTSEAHRLAALACFRDLQREKKP